MPIPHKILNDIQHYIHDKIEKVDEEAAYYSIFLVGNAATHIHNIDNEEVLPDLLREVADHLESGTFFELPNEN